MMSLAPPNTDGEDPLLKRDAVGEHRLCVVHSSVKSIISAIWRLRCNGFVVKVACVTNLFFVFNDNNKVFHHEDKLGLSLSCPRLRASYQSFALPKRPAILLPRTIHTDRTTKISYKSRASPYVTQSPPLINMLPLE